MRVKPKWDGGPGYPVVREYAEHFIVQDPECQHQLLALPKSDYEPVPEVTWRDVTAEFNVEDNPSRPGFMGARKVLANGKDVIADLWLDCYRLRKICVNESEDSVFHEINTAFVIEKKEPA